MVQHRVAAAVALAVLAMSSAASAIPGVDAAHSAMPAGFHPDRAGCYVPDVPTPEVWRRLPAQHVSQRHDLRAAIAEYRLAAAKPPIPGAQPSYHDLVTRLPLSVALYRGGRAGEARSEWRTMLSNRIAYAQRYGTPKPPTPPSVNMLAQRRLDRLAEREMPGGWADFYGTGAGQHMARGYDAAKRGHDASAAAQWRCAAKASPEFQLPHLMLGYVAALRGDVRTAKREWIATLEGFQPGPGDMYSITAWQYDAMEALLRYS